MRIQYSEKFLRQRKMLLVLPLIVIPLLCLAFYALGGGAGKTGKGSMRTAKGLNMSLPGAKLDTRSKVRDKLGYYKQADQDSLRLMESRRRDPFYDKVSAEGAAFGLGRGLPDTFWRKAETAYPALGGSRAGTPDRQAEELLKKLELLKTVLNGQAAGRDSLLRGTKTDEDRFGFGIPGEREREGVERAGSFAGGFNGRVSREDSDLMGTRSGDPDLERLSGMLDKILRIQNPEERRPGDTAMVSRVGPVAHLELAGGSDVVKTMAGTEGLDSSKTVGHRAERPGPGRESGSEEEVPGTGFFDLDETPRGEVVGDELFEATVVRDQTLVPGESVEFRLSQDALINFGRIPKGTLLSGKASLSGERLLVNISSIRVGNLTVPVSLEVVDMDGMTGIRERGSINRDVAKESAGEAVSGVGLSSVDPGLGAQVMSASLQAAKTLVNRKVRLVRVSLKAGYQVLLRNTKVNH